MTGYKGKIYFYKNLKCDFIGCSQYDHFANDDNYCILGECEVDVKFIDSRAAEIASLEKHIEKERAESQHRINQMLGKIQELQALEVLP